MVDYYKILVRTGDGRDNYEPDPLYANNIKIEFEELDRVLNLAYELFDFDQTRKVTIEEYEGDKKVREIEIFVNTRQL